MTSPKATSRRERLNLRITPEEQGLIDRAAALAGKTRAAFIIEAARRAAEEALLDRTILHDWPRSPYAVPG